MTDRRTTGERLAVLETRLDTINLMLGTIADEMKAASASRKKSYETQEATARDLITVNARLGALEHSIEHIRPTTDEYERMRDNVTFAGRLGVSLWQIGKAVIAAAVGAAAAYYWITGRPPP